MHRRYGRSFGIRQREVLCRKREEEGKKVVCITAAEVLLRDKIDVVVSGVSYDYRTRYIKKKRYLFYEEKSPVSTDIIALYALFGT